ncbi:hypothetical protein JH06_1164 [Blastocystis sp. subtype 4]|uniref:hypothetical protein n=1 Tax=Blastocystis sp. subtype 4 TaxID=944170 RepID=UPI0007122BC4|nr:hypothetical protein JH06_1164 [Blastocystis sp. subtype 4]KNB45463.1 hypothetical protein JH06_1164 [Blastocystis sp. subtype 4]|eukprot:XP_014528903.1 hypothetical protein JH06_1164 [Blastocystis sp. subtype 4]
MENAQDQAKEEVNVDFGEDAPQNEPELSLESLDKLAENIDAEQNDDLQKVKEMAAENNEKINAVVQLPTDRDNIDERSIFVKQVDYGVTPQELMEYFSTCGSITRIKILTTKQGVPKGAAYIEFADPESVKSALMFSGNSFHDRTLVVEPKRKNIPRHFLHRGRGRGRGGYHRGAYRSY